MEGEIEGCEVGGASTCDGWDREETRGIVSEVNSLETCSFKRAISFSFLATRQVRQQNGVGD